MYYILNPLISQIKLFPSFAYLYAKKSEKLIPVAKVNDAACEILCLCNGQNSHNDIKQIMFNIYGENEENSIFVENYLKESVDNKLIIEQESLIKNISIKILGSKTTWVPEFIAVDLTNDCVLKCKHCYLNAGEGDIKYISNNSLDKLVSEVIDLKIPMVQLTGGEPLLHPYVFEIMKKLLKNNITVQLFTSGFISNESILNKLLELKSNNLIIQVSIDGAEDYHNKFRGNINAYKQTIRFVEFLTKNNFQVFVGTTVDEQSDIEIFALAEKLKKLQIRLMRIGTISLRGRALENEISISAKKNLRIINLKNQLAKRLNDEKFKIELIEDVEKMNICGNCGLGQLTLKIDSGENVYPCVMSDLKIGNYKLENIKQIQDRSAGILSKVQPPVIESCKKCEKYNLCNKCIIEALINCKHDKTWYKENINFIENVEVNYE